MAEQVTLGTFNTLQNSSIISTLNSNNVLIENAFTDCLSLSGTAPNAMQSNLDMNSNQIINLPPPSTINSPIRVSDVNLYVVPGPQGIQGPSGPPGTGSVLPNINTLTNFPLVPDGVTSNISMLQSLPSKLPSVAPEMPVPVNITVGNPTVLSINPTVPSGGTLANPTIHYLKPNQAFYFTVSPGGSLPSGISLGTFYYITSANLTATTFTFSTVNNYGFTGTSYTAEGSTVSTSGSAVGTVSIVLTGRDVNIVIPPGPYFSGNYGDAVGPTNITPNGITRIRYFAYGSIFDTKITFGAPWVRFISDPKTWQSGVYDLVNTTPNELVSNGLNGVVTLQTPANAANYYVGQWISIFGIDVQDPLGTLTSGPTNNQYQEFKQIISINPGTGELTLDGPLKWVYLSTFPNLFNAVGLIGGGAAIIAPMSPSWDTEIEVHGARWIGEAASAIARRFMYKDCVFQGYGDFPGQIAPSVSQCYTYRNCRFGPGGTPASQYMEVDKMIEYLELDSCSSPSHYTILFQSPSVQSCRIKNHQGSSITGTPRQISITDSLIQGVTVGPYLGVTDSCCLNNNRFSFFDMLNRNDDANSGLGPNNDMTLVPNWSFSNGTFTRNITAVPGLQSMSWQIPGAKVYLTDASNQYKYFQNMGAPFTILNVYMDGSGNFSFDTTLSAVPTRQTTIAVTGISNATPCVVTTTAPHGLSNGDPVCFTTSGVLPAPLLKSTIYWVANKAASTFQLALTKAAALAGTPVINSTTAGSGTHTAYGNPLCFRPHPCTRFTSIGNSGCTALLDLNGAVDEPLFSRVRRSFVGKQSTLGGNPSAFQQPNPNIWGFLKSMTVNVRKAGTASGTLTISCPGFTQPNLGLSTFSQTIDTTVAGVRSWVGSAAPTGSAGADSIVAYADWIAGPLIFTWSTGVTLPNSPVVEFEMSTDQGIIRFGNMQGAPAIPASGSNLWQYIDSGIIEQYGSLP